MRISDWSSDVCSSDLAAAAAPAGEEAIVVTGSRIARETYDTPAPVIGVSSEDLIESGDSELSETLADLPQLSSSTNDSTVTGNTQNSGLSSIELRGLGSSEEHTSALQSLMRISYAVFGFQKKK